MSTPHYKQGDQPEAEDSLKFRTGEVIFRVVTTVTRYLFEGKGEGEERWDDI